MYCTAFDPLKPMTSSDMKKFIMDNPEIFDDSATYMEPSYWLCTSVRFNSSARGYTCIAFHPYRDIDLGKIFYVQTFVGFISRECYEWLKATYPKQIYRR